MLAQTHNLLEKAHRGHYAVGAFNINNLETLQGIVRGAETAKAPVIVQTSEVAWDYAGMEELGALVQVVAKKAKVPVALNFDHGRDVEKVKRAIESGLYSSVMIDASHLPFEENMAATKEIVKLAHKNKVTVEAELGRISGTEDYIVVKDREGIGRAHV